MKSNNHPIVEHNNRWHWGETVDLIAVNGVAAVKISFEDENPGVAFVSGLIVREEHRRQGWASALLEAVEHECRQRGCFRIDLETYVEPAWLEEFYIRRGFTHKTGSQYPTVNLYKLLI